MVSHAEFRVFDLLPSAAICGCVDEVFEKLGRLQGSRRRDGVEVKSRRVLEGHLRIVTGRRGRVGIELRMQQQLVVADAAAASSTGGWRLVRRREDAEGVLHEWE